MAYCNKKIGGVSGNILGANEQISEIMFLLVFMLFMVHYRLRRLKNINII